MLDVLEENQCLVIYREQNKNQYRLKVETCQEYKVVVCKTESTKPDNNELEETFPCISKQSNARKKRQSSFDSFKIEGLGENGNQKGKFST